MHGKEQYSCLRQKGMVSSCFSKEYVEYCISLYVHRRFLPALISIELSSPMTVHFGSKDRPLSSWIAHFGSVTVKFDSRPSTFGRTIHYRATVHFKNGPLSPFWTKLDLSLELDESGITKVHSWRAIIELKRFAFGILSLNY